jgi:hypothetical protein
MDNELESFEEHEEKVFNLKFDEARSLEEGISIGKTVNKPWFRMTLELFNWLGFLTRLQVWGDNAIALFDHLK